MNSLKRSDQAKADRANLALAIRQVAAGERGALRTVFDQTSAKLFGICFRICGESQAAEDVMQDVYVTLWRRAGSFDPVRASPITWLATIARNRSIDWLRSQRQTNNVPVEMATALTDTAPLASDLIEASEEYARLHGCLEELEPHTSQAIRSAFLDGLTYNELAERASVPLGTMKSWIRRGLQRLKACLGDD